MNNAETPTDDDLNEKNSLLNESNPDTPGFPSASYKGDELSGSRNSKYNLIKEKRLIDKEVQCILVKDG